MNGINIFDAIIASSIAVVIGVIYIKMSLLCGAVLKQRNDKLLIDKKKLNDYKIKETNKNKIK